MARIEHRARYPSRLLFDPKDDRSSICDNTPAKLPDAPKLPIWQGPPRIGTRVGMPRRREHWRGQTKGGRTRPLGLVLALFALLCQSLVLLLPQSSMAMSGMAMETPSLPADAALFTGGYILCQDEDAPPADPDKAPCSHCVDCPVCQAVHLGTGFVPPTVAVLPVPTAQAVAFVPTAPRAQPRHPVARAHQPRAPPLVSSL